MDMFVAKDPAPSTMLVSKGDVTVTFQGAQAITAATMELGWDSNDANKVDLDIYLVARNKAGQLLFFNPDGTLSTAWVSGVNQPVVVYYGNAKGNKFNQGGETPNPFQAWAHHLGDSLEGKESAGDADEIIEFTPTQLAQPAWSQIAYLDVGTTIEKAAERRQSFIDVNGTFVRLMDRSGPTPSELFRLDLTTTDVENATGGWIGRWSIIAPGVCSFSPVKEFSSRTKDMLTLATVVLP